MTEVVSPYQNQPKKNKNKLLPIIGVLIIIAVIGGFFMYRQSKQANSKQTVTETPAPSPSPTMAVKIDKSTVKIQVQNGTGTPGQASTVVNMLKSAGYNTDNIKTANAADLNTSATTVSAKTGFESVASDISNALKSTFSDITTGSTPLDSKSEFDIVIVTGGKTYQAATPTTSSKPSASPTSSVTSTPSPTSTPTPTPTP